MPQDYVGPVMTLANQKRGVQMNMAYHGKQVHADLRAAAGRDRAGLLRQAEVGVRGYASMDYEFKEYRASDVVKVDILINGDRIDALAIIVHRTRASTAAARWRPRCAS
jgi:GTP-binding protein LepA